MLKERLGDIAEIISGQSPPGSSYNETGQGMPFFQGKAEFGDIHPVAIKWCTEPKKIAETGDILMSVRAPVGPTNIAAEKCCIGRGLAAIRPDIGRIDRDYLIFYLKKIEKRIAQSGQGSTFKAISRKDLINLEVPVFPISQQKQITDTLRRAEGTIRLRKEQLAKTQSLVPALFIDMFGNPATNPKGWKIFKLGNYVESANYGTSKKAHESEIGHPIVRMGNVTYEGDLKLDDLKYINLDNSEYEKARLQEGDILFNRTNSKDLVGKTGIWDGRYDAVAASYFIRVRVNRDVLNPYFVWAYMNSRFMKRRLFETARGAIGQSNINAKELQAFEIPIPDVKLQNEYQEKIKEFQSSVEIQEQALQKQQALFQSLLHHAFRGEL